MCSTTAASSPQKFCQTLEIRHICTDDFAIVNLLSSFGVSKESIDVFLANKYTVESLRIIERSEVEPLIRSPNLVDRTLIIHGLNNWRKVYEFLVHKRFYL